MKINKLLGTLVALAMIGLPLGDALTGYGIKGNKNLNPLIVGDGSNSSSSTTSSSTTTSTTSSANSGNEIFQLIENGICTIKVFGKDGKLKDQYDGTEWICKEGTHSCKPECVAY